MGQIVGLNAKPKRANLNALSLVTTPAAGEHILVSSDNSMNAAGQGNFDCYIVGDGSTAASELELKTITDFVYGRKTNKTTLQEFYWIAGVSDANHPLGGINYIASNQGYAVSNFIDVHNAHKISFISLKGTGNNTVRYYAGYAFYDSNKNALSGHKTTTTRTYEVEAAEVDIPSGAYYFRYTTDINTEGCNEYTIWKRYEVANGVNIVDDLETGGSGYALSAEQGKILNNRAAIDTMPLSTPVLKTSAFINALISDVSYGQETTINSEYIGVTDYIECENYSKISFYGLRTSTTSGNASIYKGGLVFYDSEKDTIQDGACITHIGPASSFGAKKFEVEVPDNAVYFRYTLYPSVNEVEVTLREASQNIVYKSEVVNNLEDGGINVPLSAEQGKVLLGLASYTDEIDTSLFTGDTQDTTAATIEKVNGEWVITKGTQNARGVGLYIGMVPASKEYTWIIEYSSTSTKDANIRFSTEINTNTATHVDTGAVFLKNTSHGVVRFNAKREDSNYLTITTTHLTDGSVLTIHSIRVYNRQSVQEIGEIVDQGIGGSGSGADYSDVLSLYSEKKALADNMLHGNTNFSCLLFSDLHGDTTNLNRIIALYDGWNNYFTCGINVGDTIYENLSVGNSWYWASVGEREILLAIGNHDVWNTADGGYNNSIEQTEYDSWVVPLVNRVTNLVRPSNADSERLPYYYKDYGNIRVIVLSTYTNRLSSDLAWFTNALSDAITNSKKVIVVNHVAHSLVSRSGTTIQHNIAAEGDYNNGFKSYICSNSQQGYVDAPSGDTDNIGNGFVVAVKTFMDNGGIFITWINGHCHRDFFTDLSGTTHETTCGKQAFITLSTARADYQNDNPKTWPDGTGMDSFYMFSVDEELGVFKLMKFGAETDYAMRPRKFLAYSYVEHKIVAQS